MLGAPHLVEVNRPHTRRRRCRHSYTHAHTESPTSNTILASHAVYQLPTLGCTSRVRLLLPNCVVMLSLMLRHLLLMTLRKPMSGFWAAADRRGGVDEAEKKRGRTKRKKMSGGKN